MRLLLGIVLGVALTVGVAFVSDNWTSDTTTGASNTTGSTSTVAEHRNMVNWDVVDANLRVVQRRAREAWSRLSHKVSG